MISDNVFSERLKEVNELIYLIPDKPTSNNSQQIDALTRAATVLLCSHFEGVIKEVMEEFIDILNEENLTLNELSTSIIVQNRFINGNTSNFKKLCELYIQLASDINKNSVEILDKNNFNKTNANPSPEVINSMFEYIGVNEVLTTLNENILGIKKNESRKPFLNKTEIEELKKHQFMDKQINILENLLKQNRSKVKKDNNRGFYNDINTLLDYRNNIVHGNKERKISKLKLVEIKSNIERVIEELIKVLNDKIKEYQEQLNQDTSETLVAVTIQKG